MPRKSKKQPDERFVELPEDRIDQTDKPKTMEEVKKETPRKRSTPRKAKQTQSPKVAQAGDSEEPKPLQDELLLDVRQALISESQAAEEKAGLFRRLRKRFKKAPAPALVETQAQREAVVGTQADLLEGIPELKPKKKGRSGRKQEEIAVQEFFSDLEALADVEFEVSPVAAVEIQAVEPVPPAPEPEKMIQLPRLPDRVGDEVEVDFAEVREIALQEYEGAAVEPEIKVPLQEEVRKTIRELRPFERVVLILFAVLTVGTLLSAGVYLILDTVISSSFVPVPTPTADLKDKVYPIQLSLPGGREFDLGKGSVVDGKWMPQAAEWLVGTEISRWVALPWSLQLEAVLRTLHSDDRITLTMSNYETLVFDVYSIQELTMAQIQALDPQKSCLLIILFGNEENPDSHWVVTALPNQ